MNETQRSRFFNRVEQLHSGKSSEFDVDVHEPLFIANATGTAVRLALAYSDVGGVHSSLVDNSLVSQSDLNRAERRTVRAEDANAISIKYPGRGLNIYGDGTVKVAINIGASKPDKVRLIIDNDSKNEHDVIVAQGTIVRQEDIIDGAIRRMELDWMFPLNDDRRGECKLVLANGGRAEVRLAARKDDPNAQLGEIVYDQNDGLSFIRTGQKPLFLRSTTRKEVFIHEAAPRGNEGLGNMLASPNPSLVIYHLAPQKPQESAAHLKILWGGGDERLVISLAS